MVSHWNAAGVPDGSTGKLAGIGLVPLIMVALVALLAFLPRIDPLRKNYAAFRNWYDGFILVFVLFLLAVQCQIILWSLGHPISMNLVMPVLVGLLFIYIGFFLERVEPNWFAGIRTPWTLSSATVWKKTHILGGKLFKITGIVSCAGAVFPGFCHLVHPGPDAWNDSCHGCLFLVHLPEGEGKFLKRSDIFFGGMSQIPLCSSQPTIARLKNDRPSNSVY